MCDQDHFEDDKLDYEAKGLVTRRQFGVLLGAGVAMMLPRVVNAVTVTDGGRHHHDARRHLRRLLRAPGERHRARRAAVAGHLRAAPGDAPDGQAARRVGLLGARRESVLSQPRRRRPRHKGAATPIQELMPLAQRAERDDAHDRRQGVHRVARSAAVGREEQERSARRATAWAARWRSAPRRRCPIASARSRRSTAADSSPTAPNSPHLQASKTKAQFLIAVAANDDQRAPTDKDVLKETFEKAEPAGGDRGLHRRRARLVPAGLGRLQRAAGREGVEPPARAVRQSAGVNDVRGARCRYGVRSHNSPSH